MSMFVPLVLSGGESDLPISTNPIIKAELAEFVREGNKVLLGPHLMTSQEIDDFVEYVRSEAEAFRRMAKHELEIANTRSRGREA